ncbi:MULTISPECIES: hypothetical protein [unclassified Mesorhizobium]|uniref:hypothetical protein n=1 Tax=unclassified Mesorhizobium TaxID=325217 RepID=UPI001FEE219D|nr:MULTISPECIES: hypothetical protein [unclassified Mesorhizobium]
MQRHCELLGREIPDRYLHGLLKRQRERTLVAPTGPADPVGNREWGLAFKARPDLSLENPGDFTYCRQSVEKDLDEAETAISVLVNQFKRGDIGLVGADLAVADDTVTGKLKAGEFERRNTHLDLLVHHTDI